MSRKARTDEDDKRLRALGRAISELRKGKGTSQELLAYLANVDRSHMGKIERGERNVTALNLLRIADALEVKPSSIFEMAGL